MLASIIVALVAVGLLTGRLRRPGLYAVQPIGALVFLAVAVAALAVPAGIGLYVVGVGLIAHAAWDTVHWRANAIVARSLAEWCAVFDLVLGVGILILAS